VPFSLGEFALEPSGRKKEGKLELQKFLETFLAKGQKALIDGNVVRLSHFFLTKECLAL